MSGKGSRAKSVLDRLNKKKARKIATQATYEGYIKAGRNKKSKRSGRAGMKGLIKNKRHEVAFCGNLGCSACFPEFSNPLTAPRGSALWGRGQHMKWLKTHSYIHLTTKDRSKSVRLPIG